ncbi:hypothetical protein AB0E01_39705 [Nocardia vinacea]|uniref:PspA-associated protein PspAB n=1 Tax=Nocardia vinacea TaxID=96468 RepID=UPI0033DAE8B9
MPMSFLDTLLGRTRPVPPNLDALFAIPPATYTLQAALELRPTGVGAVLQARAALSGELPIEPELERWFPL